MSDPERPYEFRFVDYGTRFDPAPDTVVLDVGMRTVPGVIDHHHPEAEPECTASLIAKHPELVLDHIPERSDAGGPPLVLITHRFPDFDALASAFLTIRLAETRLFDPAMEALASYTKAVDSASLPPSIELGATPYGVLRALFSGGKGSEDEINRSRADEGLRFMRFLHARSAEGRSIVEDKRLFLGIDRFERAMRKVDEDHLNYLQDAARSPQLVLNLPRMDGPGRKTVDGLVVANPRCFLLKEWARRDRERSLLGGGFSFVMSQFGDSRFILGVDPASGVHLRGLGTLIGAREKARRESLGKPPGAPWYEGNNRFFEYRIVDSPTDDSDLTPSEVLEAVLEFGEGRLIPPER